jgi:hypothetical protein
MLTKIFIAAFSTEQSFRFFSNLSKWKAYFYYFAFCCIGITIGIIAAMSEKTIATFSGDQLLQMILLVSILSVTTFISFLITKSGNVLLGYAIMLSVIGLYLPSYLEKLTAKPLINQEDILILSKHYENTGNFKKAGDFLKVYKSQVETTSSKPQFDLITHKINFLDSMSILSLK